MKIDSPCVTVNDCIASDGSLRYGIKIQLKDAEVNIWIKPEEMDRFSEVATASWDDRASIQIGSCFDAPVYWCCGADSVSILIGQDDETWDVCFTVQHSVIRDIQAELQTKKAEQDGGGQPATRPESK
jgi:hypothetical protein